MRERLWRFIAKKHPIGELLSRRLIVVRAILFPGDFINWWLRKNDAYQFYYDGWCINGVHYSRDFFYMMSKARGETYKITNEFGRIYLERVDE